MKHYNLPDRDALEFIPGVVGAQRVKVPPVPFTRQTFFHKESLIKETGF